MFLCFWRRKSDDTEGKLKGILTDEELQDLTNKIAEAAKLQAKLPSKENQEGKEYKDMIMQMKTLGTQIDTICAKVKKLDKTWYDDAHKACDTFMKGGKADELQKSLKSYKAKFF